MKIQSFFIGCLLLLGTQLSLGTQNSSAQSLLDSEPVALTGPDGQIVRDTPVEELPPSYTNPVEPLLPEPLAHEFHSGLRPTLVPHGPDLMAPWHNLRIWNLPYGVWILLNDMEPLPPSCHTDPTGLAPACFSSHSIDGDVTLYFARTSLDLYNPAKRFEAKVRLVPGQTVDFDFAREGGQTGYGNMVRTNLLVELPQPANETTYALPVAATMTTAAQAVSLDGDAISDLLHCRDLGPNVFSDRLRIYYASNLGILPADTLGNIRLCQIAIEDSNQLRLTDKWTLHGKIEVHSAAGPFVFSKESSDGFELDVAVAKLPTADDSDQKVLVLKETGLSLQVKLQNPQWIDNTIYQHALLDYLSRLTGATEGTIRITDVKLKLNGVPLADACTADVSPIQIHFVKG